MTINTAEVVAGPYTLNGVATTFPFGFQVLDKREVRAEIDGGLVDSSQYQVALNADGTGSITFFVPRYSGKLSIYSAPAFHQPVALENQGPYFQSIVEEGLDRATVLALWLKARIDRLVPTGLFGAAAGKFLAWDALNRPFLSSGTGSDAGLRVDLTEANGAALIRYGERTLLEKSDDVTSAKDKGAIGGRTSPFPDDTAALQRLLDDTGTFAGDMSFGAGYVPAGLYRLSASLVPQNYSRLEGTGPYQSVLYNQQDQLAAPAFKVEGVMAFCAIGKLGARGYASFLDVGADTDNNLFEDIVAFGMTDAGFRFRGALYTSEFHRVEVASSARGVVVQGLANCNRFYDPEFKNLTGDAFTFNGSEDTHIIGARVEGPKVPGKALVRLASGKNHIVFTGGYIEGAMQYLVDGTGADESVVVFDGVHFTYYDAATAYGILNIDNVRLVFRNCHSTIPMEVRPDAVLEGRNTNIYQALPSLAATTTLTVPRGRDVAIVTAGDPIEAITGGPDYYGHRITLLFNAATTVRDAVGNLKLAGDLVAAPNDTLTLVNDVTHWREMARSVNGV